MNTKNHYYRNLSLWLLVGFGTALSLRLLIGGVGIARSPAAGIVFAACLLLLCFTAGGVSFKLSKRVLIIGIAGALILCVPSLFKSHRSAPEGNYISWALITTIVALAEEAFLRGVLYDTLQRFWSDRCVIILTAILFSLLHLPIYGWHILPLDFVVGLWLGALRKISGTWIAPGLAHTLADLGGWWLR